MTPLRNLSIRAKVALMGTLLIVAFLVLGASFAFSLNTVLQSNLLLGRTQNALRESSELLNSILELRTRLRDHLRTGGPDSMRAYNAAQYDVFEHIENLRTSVSDPALKQPMDRTALNQISKIDAAVRNWKAEVADPFLKGPLPAGERTQFRFMTLSEDRIKTLRQEVKDFQAEQQRLNARRYVEADQAATFASKVAFLGSGLALLLVLLGFSVLTRSIKDPLFNLIEMGQAIAAGDYSQRLPSPGRNELGRLAGAFNVMAQNLETVRGEQAAIRSRLEALNRLAAYVSRSLYTRDRAEAVVMTLHEHFGTRGVQVWLAEGERGWLCIEVGDGSALEYRLYSQLPEMYQGAVTARRFEPRIREENGEVDWTSPLYRGERLNGILRIRFPADQWAVAEPLLSSIHRFCTHAFEISRVYEEVSSERHRLDAILNSTAEGVLVVDRQGKIVLANPAALRVLRLTDRPVTGLPVDEALDGDAYASLRHFMASAPDDARGTEESGALPFGERFVNATRAPIQDHGVLGTVFVIRDVTQQVEVDRMKSEFISIVSHELRTPLTSIKGSLGLILGGAGGEVPDKTRQLLNIAQSNSDRLIRLINDILDISKIEAGRVEMSREPVDIREALRCAVKDLGGMAQQERVRLEVTAPEAPLAVMGDSDRLCQVLVNLVSNAIKFSPPDSTVEIRAEAYHHVVVVDVIDQGPGIPIEHQAKLFQKFYQVDSSSARAKSGTGLGLAISNAIVKEHSGLMGVESQEGEGCRFWFTLPLLRPTATPQEAVSAPPRVLVGHPDPQIVRQATDLMVRHGYLCDRVQTAAELLLRTKQAEYDLLLMDLSFPDMDGLDLIRRLDETSARDLPLAFLDVIRRDSGEARLRVAGWRNRPLNEKRFQDTLRDALKFGRRKSDELSPEAAPLVLVVNEDPDHVRFLSSLVLATGMRVATARGEESARGRILEETPEALVLDPMILRLDTRELIRVLKEQEPGKYVPTLVVSGREVASGDAEAPGGEARAGVRTYEEKQALVAELSGLFQGQGGARERELARVTASREG